MTHIIKNNNKIIKNLNVLFIFKNFILQILILLC